MRKIASLMVFALIILLLAPVFADDWKETEISRKVPLPRNIKIVPPGPALAPEIAAFSGRWEGTWETSSALDVMLIVETVSEKEAKVIYAWGNAGNIKRDYSRYPAKIIAGEKPNLKFEISVIGGGTTRTFTFELQEDLKTLKGKAEGGGRLVTNRIIMKKIE